MLNRELIPLYDVESRIEISVASVWFQKKSD